jgi:hypothetical protein
MSSNFAAALDAEIAELERQLEASPTFVKLRQLRDVRALYVTSGEASDRPTASVAVLATRRDNRSPHKKEEILRAAENRLEGRTAPTPTAELYARLTEAGIEIPGEKPRNYLSALLSRNDRFKSHGRAGWTLVPGATNNSNGASHEPAPSPSFESGSDREPYEHGHDLLNQPAG